MLSGDAELKGSGFSHPAGLDDISEDDMGSKKGSGRAVSIETASLDVYAKYVLKSICQQVRIAELDIKVGLFICVMYSDMKGTYK